MTVFKFQDYKQFFRERLRLMPKRGHGQLLKIAKLLNIHTTMLTHVFKGDSQLSMEQALKLSGYLGLDGMETDYFMNLVQLARAGDSDCRRYFEGQLEKIRQKALNLKERLSVKRALEEADQAKFYSDWAYAGVHLLTAIEQYRTPHAIAQALRLPVQEVHRILRFLVSVGLSQEENESFSIGEAQTFVGRDSPFLRSHLVNWRMRAMEQFHALEREELVFSNPVVVSRADFVKIHERLVDLLKDFRKIAEPSPCELLACLNVDWVRVR